MNAKKELLNAEPSQPTTEQDYCERDLDDQEDQEDQRVQEEEEDIVTNGYKGSKEPDGEEITNDKRQRELLNSCSEPQTVERDLDEHKRTVIKDEEDNRDNILTSNNQELDENVADKKTDDFDIKIGMALEKTVENEKDKNMEDSVQRTEVEEPCPPAQLKEGVKEEKESTLEELMSLLIESLRTTNEMRPMESPCVVQNLNQVIVVRKDSDIRHDMNVQATQTMAVTQASERDERFAFNDYLTVR